ncbi:MAG: glycosyltransferase family 4 protein [Spirulina sp. DLM2.Bin59]|nr:MAG: glycosyltransferase family 4 protein [Spirulina sp. DLM2.Bin59]
MAVIHLWVPNIFEFKGGIQTYSGFVVRGIQELRPDLRLEVFLKHDRRTVGKDLLQPRTRFHFGGHWPLRVRTWGYVAQLLYGVWRSPPDLIIATHTNFAPLAALMKRWWGIPYWAVAHGIEVWDVTDQRLIASFAQADRLLAVSHYSRDRLLAEQPTIDPARVTVLPNTFDANLFYPAPKPPPLLHRYNLTPHQPVILTVARLDQTQAYKGYDQILRALPQVRQLLPDVHYLLVGKGNDRPRVEQLITKLGLEGAVTLAGFVPDEELAAHYQLCDLFAMPSRGEGFGIVYLEAIATGKPTLGGNQDGAIDALRGGELGVLVDPDDVAAIARTLTANLTQTYPHPRLYDPAALRASVIQAYGYRAFKQNLATQLAPPWRHGG